MIRKVGDHYVISSHQVWMPGTYDSERAARYALRFDDETLRKLQEAVKPGFITFGMLQAERRSKQAKKGNEHE